MKSLLKLSLIIAFLWLFWLLPTRPLYAESRQVYTDTIGLQQTDWVGSIRFPRFDPNLGILTGVEFALNGRLAGRAEFESLDAAASIVTVKMSASVQLQRPNGSQILEAVPEAAEDGLMQPFDQEIDFGGDSGSVFPSLIDIDIVESDVFSTTEDLSLFSGVDPIDLPVAATGSASGSGGGNLALNYVTRVSAMVTVTYLYESATIDLEKYTNGDDADLAPGVLLPINARVTWTYVITNTGVIDLVEVGVLDDQEGIITCPSTELAAGASMTCTLVSAAGAQPLQYTNVATVTAKTPDDGVNIRRTVKDTDPSNYYGSKLAACPLDNQGLIALPAITFLGPGPGVFVLPDGYDTFIVKRRSDMGLPFKFDTDPGVVNSQGERVLEIPLWPMGRRQRVWACAGQCNFVAHLDGPVELGYIDPGLTIGAVVIDDDTDTRINKWIADANGVITEYPILEQTMVEYLTFTIPQPADTWSYFAVDSVGIVDLCLAPPNASFPAARASHGQAPVDNDAADSTLFLPTVLGLHR